MEDRKREGKFMMTYLIELVIAHSSRQARPIPLFSWDCVFSDMSIEKMRLRQTSTFKTKYKHVLLETPQKKTHFHSSLLALVVNNSEDGSYFNELKVPES